MNAANGTTADIVVAGDCIFDGINAKITNGAVAISKNRIIKIGSLEEVNQLVTKETRQYQFNDKLIMPGFNDNHVHIFCGSLSEESVNLHDAKSEQEAALLVNQFAKENPGEDWIIGFGWYHVFWEECQLPTKFSLDYHMPDKPVFLINAELHGAWVNSKALKICGITANTPDPPYGKIERDSHGNPTGFLYETAMGLVSDYAFHLKEERKKEIFERFLQKAARLGVTSVSDMMPLPGMELGLPEVYHEFETGNQLTTRIHMVLGLGDDLSRAQKFRQIYKSDKLQFSALKSFLDGVATTYTALMLDPYKDKPESKGTTLIPIDIAKDWVCAADKNGYKVRLHACGDGAVRLGLDFFEAAGSLNGRRDARHSIEHIENIHPDDAKRFSEIGVIASVQPEHLAITEQFSQNPYRQRLGEEREQYSWPNKTLLENNAHLALGSDFPVVDMNPMLELYRAVTRIHNDGNPQGGWIPEQKLSLYQAIKAYTYGSAYALHRENELGTLEPGKFADIVVLDRNPFEKEAEDILKTKVVFTVMDGQVIYQE